MTVRFGADGTSPSAHATRKGTGVGSAHAPGTTHPIDSPTRIGAADPPFDIAFSWSGGIAEPSDSVG